MSRVFWIFFAFEVFVIKSVSGQCPEMVIVNEDFSNEDLMRFPTLDLNKVLLIGGYIHDFEFIEIRSCCKSLFKSQIDNLATLSDGPSFRFELNLSNLECDHLILVLDGCYFIVEVVKGTRKLFFNRSTSALNITISSTEEED